MTRQKIIFLIIVGSAVMFIVSTIALNPFLLGRFGPPDLTATETAMAIRATDVSLSATEVAIAATQAVIEAGETPVVEEATSLETVNEAPAPIATVQTGAGNLTWDGLQIDIATTNYNAWPLIKAQNQFNDPPGSGQKMFMLTLKVTNVEGPEDEFIKLYASDFRLIGSRNIAYTTWGEETSCGVAPSELNGVVARGTSLQGNICFQVPLDESDFKLVYDSTGNYPSVYFDLPE